MGMLMREVVRHFSEFILRLLSRTALSHADLQLPVWSLPESLWPRGAAGNPRRFSPGEVRAVLEAVTRSAQGPAAPAPPRAAPDEAAGLKRAAFFVDRVAAAEEVLQNRPSTPAGAARVAGDIGNTSHFISRWVSHLPQFLRYREESGLFAVYVARDGLAGLEFESYVNSMRGRPTESGALYVPGYPEAEGVFYGRLVKQVYRDVAGEFSARGVTGSAYDHEGHGDFYRRFREEVDKHWSLVRAEAEYIYRQFRQVPRLPESGKIQLIDFLGTGKTLFFIKRVIEHFGEGKWDVHLLEASLLPERPGGLKADPAFPNLGQVFATEFFFGDLVWPFGITRVVKDADSFGMVVGYHPGFSAPGVMRGVDGGLYAILNLVYRSLRLFNLAWEYVYGGLRPSGRISIPWLTRESPARREGAAVKNAPRY